MTFFYHFGKYLLFMKDAFSKPEKFWLFRERMMQEMYSIGVGSLGIVTIISVFIGAVTTVQTAYQLVSGLVSKSIIGTIVSDSTILELAPTITSLVLAGKIGSSIAGEIGTMRVTEQIDALEIMGINSANYLVLPKVVASMVMIPMLIIIAIFLGISGGMLAGKMSGILPVEEFMKGARSTFKGYTVFFACTKAVTFAYIITSVSAFQGYFTQGGALEVGQSSTKAVVYSAVLILFADYVLAQLML
jgi:phospholipid/cholesterol/gamma-HCH transport system permease protein